MAGQKGRISILRMMVVVSIVAAECGLLRALWHSNQSCFAPTLIVLPLLNLMLLGLPRLRHRHEARYFWIGFEAAGLVLVGLVIFLIWYDASTLIHPISWLYQKGWLSEDTPEHLAATCACVIAIYAPPQLLAASVVGWLLARYRVVIERRLRAADPQVGVDVDLANGRPIEC